MTFKGFKSMLMVLCLIVPAVASANCDDIEYRQFDFWLGDWNVKTTAGKLAGDNKITKVMNGCVLKESYSTPSGYHGESFNIYDRATQKWHQTWVDNSGLLLRLSGQLEGSAMVMSGPGKSQSGEDVTHKITWTPKQDGSVRQHWQMSRDSGQSWQTLFDGIYTHSSDN